MSNPAYGPLIMADRRMAMVTHGPMREHLRKVSIVGTGASPTSAPHSPGTTVLCPMSTPGSAAASTAWTSGSSTRRRLAPDDYQRILDRKGAIIMRGRLPVDCSRVRGAFSLAVPPAPHEAAPAAPDRRGGVGR